MLSDVNILPWKQVTKDIVVVRGPGQSLRSPTNMTYMYIVPYLYRSIQFNQTIINKIIIN